MQALLVRYVRVDNAWIEAVRAAAQKGPICFVLRNRSLIDFLCLRGLLEKYRLPPLCFVSGLSGVTYGSLLQKILFLFRKKSPKLLETKMRAALTDNGSAAIFLRRPAVRGVTGSRPADEDGILAAVKAGRGLEKTPIVLPMVFLWGESAMRRMPGAMDFLFGSNEYPRLIRSIRLLLKRRSVHEIQVGAPIYPEAIRKERGIDDRALTAVIRAGVGRQIEIIRRAKLGALTKPSSRIAAETLGSPRLARQLSVVAQNDGIPESEIMPRARAVMRKMAADFKPDIVSLFALITSFLWRRLYTGIDIRKEDIERIKKAVGSGACLLLPSHKSHTDYLLMSHLMQENNLMLPHIAAGQNLAFWPMGFLFRSAGAFFIRRSFINDHFYTAVVAAYVRRLITAGYAVEVFIEGGRSRTGKLLRPKLGMLDMALKAVALPPEKSLAILPIFIGYEHVIEESAYAAEADGAPKKAESIKGLIKTTAVLFKRYGRLYVRAGIPFFVDEMLKEQNLTRADLKRDSVRRGVAATLGFRTLATVNQMTVVTPSSILAAVLLSNPTPSISCESLTAEALMLAGFLKSAGAPLSDTVSRWQASEEGGLCMERAAAAFVKVGRMTVSQEGEKKIYTIKTGRRSIIDYYKNNIIHFFVPASLTAAICLAFGGDKPMDRAKIAQKLKLVCDLYRHEFILSDFCVPKNNCAAPEDEMLSRVLDLMTENGIFSIKGDAVRIVDRQTARRLADMLANYHELYFAALSAARQKIKDDLRGPSLKIAQRISERCLAAGIFTKPEGHSKIFQKNAQNTLKEMKLLRAANEDCPYAEGAKGERLYCFFKDLLGIDAVEHPARHA